VFLGLLRLTIRTQLPSKKTRKIFFTQLPGQAQILRLIICLVLTYGFTGLYLRYCPPGGKKPNELKKAQYILGGTELHDMSVD